MEAMLSCPLFKGYLCEDDFKVRETEKKVALETFASAWVPAPVVGPEEEVHAEK